MLPIQSPDNLFRDGIPGSELGTILTAAWLNGMQAENLSILQAAGIAPSAATNQILLALRAAGVFQTASLNDNTTKAATTAFAQLLVNGRLVKSVAGGVTVNLSAVESSFAIIEFTGALTANIAVTVPNVSGHWTIKNGTTGAFTLTVKTAAGTGVAITQGLVWPVYCDGTNVLDAASDFKDIALSGISTAPTAARSVNTLQLANMSALAAAVGTDGGFSFRNLLINAAGTINQRGYVSGAATTAANQYTLDRWRVVTAGQNLSWAASGAVMTMTAPAGGVEQVIEGANIIGGTYVLNWTGTATATVAGTAIAKGASFTLSANSNAVVRFTGGTFSMPQIEQGAVATAFEMRPINSEIQFCQRYYEKTFPQGMAPMNGVGASGACLISIVYQGQSTSSSQPLAQWQFKVEKRATPAIQMFNPGSLGAAGQWVNGSGSATSSNARCLAASSRGATFDNSDTAIGPQTWYLHAIADAEL
ncbi:hypothetical protein [uncultured Deefgea sp.]|uniref:hypothetical protein n=1 Tax=uncultured Deefgea sp. TaxID=1304914 RepID=UPI00261DD522|nr:hypothetical protein [uncultured Deefgea sp.]